MHRSRDVVDAIGGWAGCLRGMAEDASWGDDYKDLVKIRNKDEVEVRKGGRRETRGLIKRSTYARGMSARRILHSQHMEGPLGLFYTI